MVTAITEFVGGPRGSMQPLGVATAFFVALGAAAVMTVGGARLAWAQGAFSGGRLVTLVLALLFLVASLGLVGKDLKLAERRGPPLRPGAELNRAAPDPAGEVKRK